MKSIDQVREFHVAMSQPVGDVAAPDVSSRTRLRIDLIAEEFRELAEACGYACGVVLIDLGTEPDLVEAADALADLRYVTEGAAVEWGIPLDEVTDEVHASNMRKLGGPVNAAGKLLKPRGWTPPDVAGVLARFRR